MGVSSPTWVPRQHHRFAHAEYLMREMEEFVPIQLSRPADQPYLGSSQLTKASKDPNAFG